MMSLKMCTFCDREASSSAECASCGQRFCNIAEHRAVHINPETGNCYPILVKEAEGVGR
jgi:hypothetical protein